MAGTLHAPCWYLYYASLAPTIRPEPKLEASTVFANVLYISAKAGKERPHQLRYFLLRFVLPLAWAVSLAPFNPIRPFFPQFTFPPTADLAR